MDSSSHNKLKTQTIQACAQNSFLAFCLAIQQDGKDPFIRTKLHFFLAMRLQKLYEDVKNGVDSRLSLELQPQIGKSTLSSELFPAWVLGKEGWPIIVASYGASLAERKSQACRDILELPTYQLIFPNTRLRQDSTSKEFWRTTTGGSYRAVGVGGGLTGMSGKIIVADDPIASRADADSETIRESTWKWWQTVLYTRKQSKTGFLLVNTRWHLDDISGKLEQQEEVAVSSNLPEGTFDRWERLKFAAIADEDEYLDGELFRTAGEVVCPERFTMNDMIKTRNSIEIEEWVSLYQQNPILQASAEFKKEWFRRYNPLDEEFKAKKLVYTTTVDLAISQKKSADNTVILTVGKVVDEPYWYIIDITHGRMDPLQTIEAIFDHWKRYKSKVWIESVAYQKSLGYFIKEKMKKDEVYFEVNELPLGTKTSKEEKIRGLIPQYRTGVMLHRQNEHALETELMQFPKGRHDDIIDALSMQLIAMKNTRKIENPGEDTTPKPIRWWRGRKETMDHDPNSAFTPI